MTQIELRHTIHQYREMANDAARWVGLNPANAATWKAEAAKFHALAAAAEVDLQIAIHAGR
jgi:hypothetical protein